jgi:hypothetical protein
MLVISDIGHHSLRWRASATFVTGCFRLVAFGLGFDAESCNDRLASALEVERGGTRVSEGDPGIWAAVAQAVSDRVRELGWRQRELAVRSHAPTAVMQENRRSASPSLWDILLSMPAITSGTRPFSHEALMQFRRISSAADSGSASHSADTVQPRCKSLIQRFTGRCECR